MNERHPRLQSFPVEIDPAGYWPAAARERVREAFLDRYASQIWTHRGKVVWLDTETGSVCELSIRRFRALAPEAVVYKQKKGRHPNTYYQHIDVPTRVLDDVYNGPHWPELVSVRRAPWVTAEGRLVVQPGYDAQTGIYLHWQGEPCDPYAVTQEDVEDVLARITDFQFATTADRINLLALYLQVVRMLAGCPSPLGLISALDAESGKSLVAKLIGILVLGMLPSTTILPESPTEANYTLNTYVRAEPAILWIDNVATGSTLGGPDLQAILTASSDVTSRVIGTGDVGRGDPTRIQWLATGNQIGVDLELARRVLIVQLRIRPHGRRFLTAEIDKWMLANRRRVLSVLLRLVLDWHTGGCPEPPRVLPSFESWSRLVGGPICQVPNAAAQWLSEASRPVPAREAALAELCRSWPLGKDGGHRPLAASLVLSLAEDLGLLPLVEDAGHGPERSRQTRFGQKLSVLARQERPVLGWRLIAQKSKNGPVYLPIETSTQTPPRDLRDLPQKGPATKGEDVPVSAGPTGRAGPEMGGVSPMGGGPLSTPPSPPLSPPAGPSLPTGPGGPVGPATPLINSVFSAGHTGGGVPLGPGGGPASCEDADAVHIPANDAAYERIVDMAQRGLRVDPDLWLRCAEEAERALSASRTEEDKDRLQNLRSYKMPVWRQAETGARVRCSWELQGPGRLGTVRPALHQITKKHAMRTAVQPEPGHVFVVGDWRAAHVWIAAGASRDEGMLAGLTEGHLYERAADAWRTTPERAKVCALATLNGAGPGRLAEILEDGTGEFEARKRREQWLSTYPAMRATLRGWHGRRVWRSPLGRRVELPADRADYSAVGWTLQAIEADALRLVLLDLAWPVVLTVHDEVVLEVPEADAQAAGADLRRSMDAALREVADLRDVVGDTVRVEIRRAWRES